MGTKHSEDWKARVAVVWVGYWGKNLVRNFAGLETAHLKYCMDKRKTRFDELAPQHTDTIFTDDLDDVVDGLAVTSTLPLNDICGAGSSLIGTSLHPYLVFSGGSLVAGTSCTFDVVLTVPAGTASDSSAKKAASHSAPVGL